MARSTRSKQTTPVPRSGAGPAAGRSRGGPGAVLDRAGLWTLRLAWFLAPLGLGVGLTDRLDRFPGTGAVVAELALWTAWFAGLVACLVPTTISLTVVRVAAPATVVLVVLAALMGEAGGPDGGWTGRRLAALGYATVLTVVAFLPVIGDRMINGSAYGSERRMALRPPAFALLGPVELAWVVVVAGLVTGPLLAANGRWVAGGVAAAVGVGACWLGGRVLHQLARRWIVFVPAGFVLHDKLLLVESILLRRPVIDALGPATVPLPHGAVDLSGGAYGLALEVATREPVTFGRRVRREVVNTQADRIVFTPTLPGAVLTEARIRAVRIGLPSPTDLAPPPPGQP